jgi:hypothetical protein
MCGEGNYTIVRQCLLWMKAMGAFRTRALPLAAAALLVLASVPAAHAVTCECADLNPLAARAVEIQAAIAEYRKQIEVMRAEGARQGAPLQFTEERYRKLQNFVQDAINDALSKTEGPLKGSGAVGRTLPFGCSILITNLGLSKCLKESVMRHETHHKNECERLSDSLLTQVWRGKTWQEKKTLIQFAEEEIHAYGLELAYVKPELSRLLLTCLYAKVHGRHEYSGHGRIVEERYEGHGRLSVRSDGSLDVAVPLSMQRRVSGMGMCDYTGSGQFDLRLGGSFHELRAGLVINRLSLSGSERHFGCDGREFYSFSWVGDLGTGQPLALSLDRGARLAIPRISGFPWPGTWDMNLELIDEHQSRSERVGSAMPSVRRSSPLLSPFGIHSKWQQHRCTGPAATDARATAILWPAHVFNGIHSDGNRGP